MRLVSKHYETRCTKSGHIKHYAESSAEGEQGKHKGVKERNQKCIANHEAG